MSAQTAQSDRPSPVGSISGRGLLRAAGAGAAVMGTGGLLQACSSGIKGAGSGPGGTKGITIGWIHPLTGAPAAFGAPDHRVLSKTRQTTPYKSGFKLARNTSPVHTTAPDSRSSPTPRASLATPRLL